ncbi:MAG: hypothetical protein HYV04_21355 [Deltaproteobacteria bacterium]|nr:hypothetical protein [Deltaproteobacteria bacterium]
MPQKLKGRDSLLAFAEIERLIGKIYFRFSHLFFHHLTLRDFWWEVAMEKERCAYNLRVMSTVAKNDPGPDYPSVTREKTDRLRESLTLYLQRGTPTIAPEEALSLARKIEACEINVIYDDFRQSGASPAGLLE